MAQDYTLFGLNSKQKDCVFDNFRNIENYFCADHKSNPAAHRR